MLKINSFFVIGLLLLSSQFSGAQISAHRPVHESWKKSAGKLQVTPRIWGWGDSASAYNQAKPYSEIEWTALEPEATQLEIETAFYYVRDKRYLEYEDPSQEEFLRRITWLYPDDGCFARAALITELTRETYFTGHRIFVFGDLFVETPNHPQGFVSWWFHTAPLVKSEEGDVYVLDPAVDSLQPLLVEDWIAKLGLLSDVYVSVCSADSYDPSAPCQAEENSASLARRDIPAFLRFEWKRQEELDREPHKVLGDEPPWVEVIPEPIKNFNGK